VSRSVAAAFPERRTHDDGRLGVEAFEDALPPRFTCGKRHRGCGSILDGPLQLSHRDRIVSTDADGADLDLFVRDGLLPVGENRDRSSRREPPPRGALDLGSQVGQVVGTWVRSLPGNRQNEAEQQPSTPPSAPVLPCREWSEFRCSRPSPGRVPRSRRQRTAGERDSSTAPRRRGDAGICGLVCGFESTKLTEQSVCCWLLVFPEDSDGQVGDKGMKACLRMLWSGSGEGEAHDRAVGHDRCHKALADACILRGISDADRVRERLLHDHVFRDEAGVGRGEAVGSVRRARRAGNDDERGALVRPRRGSRSQVGHRPDNQRKRDYRATPLRASCALPAMGRRAATSKSWETSAKDCSSSLASRFIPAQLSSLLAADIGDALEDSGCLLRDER